MTKRITALLLSVILCLSLTGTAFAAEADESSISAEAGSNEVTVDLVGLKEGAAYYLCSLLVKESAEAAEEDFKIVKSFNFRAKEGGTFQYTFDDETIPVLEDGNVLRLRVPGADFAGGYIEYTVGEEAPGVELDRTAATLYIGSTLKLTATPTGFADGVLDNAEVTWMWGNSNGDRAEIEENGPECTVKGLAAGEVTITASLYVGDKVYEAACDITVTQRPSGGGGGGGGGSVSSGYAVSVNRTSNGSVSVSPTRAEKGDTVTITVRPSNGYELASLTVKDADGNTIRTTRVSDTEYTFVMPDSKATVDAVFQAVEKEEAPAQPTAVSFTDVPSGYWAYEQITWAATKGIMNGYGNGIFGPENNTTRQALWMVLARLDGANPADMTAARAWAISNGVSDGTSAGGTMSRQQMVTMLYRYAQMKGYATTGSTSLSGYPDSGSVASYAQDALSWAVANGVVTGTSDGRLNPEGTASRAHFAVFMYRFCNLYGIA